MPGAGLTLSEIAARGRFLGGGGGTPPSPAPPPTGFALNGSTNPALRAMLARVAASTGSGVIVEKGDSLTAGVGAGVTVDGQTGNYAQMVSGARPYRPGAVVAGLMTAAGLPCLDAGFTGDQNVASGGLAIPAYDGRFAFAGAGWTFNIDQTASGGGSLDGQAGSILDFAPGVSVTTFEAIAYNIGGSFAVTVDGAAAAGITAPGATVSGNVVTLPGGSGFTRVRWPVTAGTHTARITVGGRTLLRSVCAWADNGIRLYNHSAGNARTGEQAAKGNGWLGGDALLFDAPDLTMIELGINDAGAGVPVATYQADLQRIIADAKVSGDVLVLWANAFNPANIATATQDSFRDACAATAAAAGVAFGDIRAALGDWASTAARSADTAGHPNRGYHADIGAYRWACIQAMAA